MTARARMGRAWWWLVLASLAVLLLAGMVRFWSGGLAALLAGSPPVAASGGGRGLAVAVFAAPTPQGEPAARSVEPESVLLLERVQASALGSAWWRVGRGGAYTLVLASDDAAALWLDGAPLASLAANDGRDRAEVKLDLAAGPHLIALSLASGQRVGWAELTVQGPGHQEARPLAAADLIPADPTALLARQYLLSGLENAASPAFWLALGGLVLLALWRWGRGLVRVMSRVRLPGGRWFWLGSASLALALYLGSWPLFRLVAVDPNLDPQRSGLYLEIFERPGQEGPSRSDRHGLLSYALHRPQASLAAFTVWRAASDGPHRMQLSGRGRVVVHLDGAEALALDSRDYADIAREISPGRGEHLLTILASGEDTPAAFQLRLIPVDQPKDAAAAGPELVFLDLGNIWGWWLGLGWLRLICLVWLAVGVVMTIRRWRGRRGQRGILTSSSS